LSGQDALDPIYFSGRAYFLVPDGKVAQKPYAVLLEAMRHQGTYAIAHVVFAGRAQLAAVHASGRVFAMTLLNYESQVKKASDFEDEVDKAKASEEERKLAETLIATGHGRGLRPRQIQGRVCRQAGQARRRTGKAQEAGCRVRHRGAADNQLAGRLAPEPAACAQRCFRQGSGETAGTRPQGGAQDRVKSYRPSALMLAGRRRPLVSLAKYQQKRRFEQTPEPRGAEATAGGPLRFVVQKHAASRLHYDFRLELDGVLKSWAVPKGPSLNPADKRLAVMVEDHPLDYRTFEGTIPKGNYGAGTVMVWDEGTYCSRQTANPGESERLLRQGLERGHLTFVLNGKKLRGEFALVRLKRGKANEWLLLKKRDEWASDVDVAANDRSVSSGRDLDEIGRASNKAPASRGGQPNAVLEAPKSPMPRHIKPMLARLVEKPFDHPGWLFEVKWDGYRAIAEVERGGVSLYSRNQQSFTKRFAPIAESLRRLGHEAVLDGEVVVVDAKGRSRFELLQKYGKTGTGQLLYYAFDLLYLDGQDLRRLPLRRRKELLAQILGGLGNVLLSEHIEEHGVAFFEAAVAEDLEGIIAKKADSPYREGRRSHDWLKLKTHSRQEAVICGFTEPRGSRKHFGALVLGLYEGDELVYIGHAGGGLDTQDLADVRARLDPLVQQRCPFRVRPRTNAPVHWVEPKLVCEVQLSEWTQDGIMRQPIFLGLRPDKPAHAVHRERAEPPPDIDAVAGQRAPDQKRPAVVQSAAESTRPALVASLTNLNKVYWPDEGYTKGDVVAYYHAMAPLILPYLRDRPQSLNRHPNGITGVHFFQKDVTRQPPPDWVKTATVRSESGKKDVTYALCQDEASLLYIANLGCIELNPWSSRVGSLDRPDYLVIDLDPENVPFARVVEAAVAVHRVLDQVGAESLCKTTGKRGLHVFVPLGARYDYGHARQFAQIVASIVHQQLPDTTSLLRSPAHRQGRVYLDCLQNARGQTLAAVYSVRPHPGATVSAPLRWREVTKRLDPARFTLKTMHRRLDQVGDLWKPVVGAGVDLRACLERLGKR
jgi:bifunctional non-homologous end joining protein LigD